MSSGITSSVQTFTTGSMSPAQGRAGGSIEPELYSSFFTDLYNDEFLVSTGNSASSIGDGDRGILTTAMTTGAFPKFNGNATDGTSPLNLACRYAAEKSRPQSLVVSCRMRLSAAPVNGEAGNVNLHISNTNSINPGAGWYGMRLKLFKKYDSVDYNTGNLELFSNGAGVATSTFWSTNEDKESSEKLAPEGFNYWDSYHDYTFVMSCPTPTTTNVMFYIDQKFVKSLTGNLDSNDRLYKFCGLLGGDAMINKDQLLDTAYVSQSRV